MMLLLIYHLPACRPSFVKQHSVLIPPRHVAKTIGEALLGLRDPALEVVVEAELGRRGEDATFGPDSGKGARVLRGVVATDILDVAAGLLHGEITAEWLKSMGILRCSRPS
eukprot:13712908-Alexandrium_andersonii.AAC.1